MEGVNQHKEYLNEIREMKKVTNVRPRFEKASNVKNTLLEEDEKQKNAFPNEEAMDEDDFVKQKDKYYPFVAAIDIGTSYSGYAYSSRIEFEKYPLKIHSPVWKAAGHISQKTSTFILYDPEDNFHSFGFEAENKYLDLLEHYEEDAVNWRAFYNFKMKLYEENETEILLDDDRGRKKQALVVFADCIRYLKDSLLKTFETHGINVLPDEVRYIITVPAIWNDKARGFMINAANEAGIQEEHLLLSLEPEAAAVLCKEHHVDEYYKVGNLDLINFDFGSEFVVADLGGGTVDITTNKMLACGSLKEIKSARGGDCGGKMVDKEFFNFIKDCTGSDYEDFKMENLCDFHELRQAFEVKKRQMGDRHTQSFVSLTISPKLAEKIDESKMKNHNDRIKFSRGKLQMPVEYFYSFFKKPIQNILKCLEEAVTDEIKSILLVGGFANCNIIYQAVKERFPGKHVFCPPDADLSVLKGAVLYGHNPDLVASRICRVWLGVIPNEDFSPVKRKDFKNDFYALTQKGQPITVDARNYHRFSVDEKCDKETLRLTVFSSESDCMPSSTSEDLHHIIHFDLPLPEPKKGRKRMIELSIKLKGTQFDFKARVKTRSSWL